MDKRSAVGLQEVLPRSEGFFSFSHSAFEFEFLNWDDGDLPKVLEQTV